MGVDDFGDDNIRFEKVYSYLYPTSAKYAQGMDIIDGCAFQAYSDGTIDVIDLDSKSLIQSLGPLLNENGKVLHMNDLSFLKVNEQKLLIIPGNSINELSHLYMIAKDVDGLYSLRKTASIPPPQIDILSYRSATQYFSDSNICIQVTYRRLENDAFGDSVITSYNYDHIRPEIIYTKNWEIVHDIMWAMQGGVIVGDCCYMAVGVPQRDARIFKVSLSDGEISCFADLRGGAYSLDNNEEMQGISYYNSIFYFSTSYGLYKIL